MLATYLVYIIRFIDMLPILLAEGCAILFIICETQLNLIKRVCIYEITTAIIATTRNHLVCPSFVSRIIRWYMYHKDH